MSGADLKEYYKHSPKITKAWFTLIIVFPLAGKFGLIPVDRMTLDWELIFNDCQITRAVTSALYFPISLRTFVHYMTALYFVFTYSCLLELSVFKKRPGTYLLFLLFSWVLSVLLALVLSQELVFDALVYAVLNLWCIIDRDQLFNIWPVFECRAARFPWLMLALQVVFTWKFAGGLIGICVSHLYYKLNKNSLVY